MRRLNTMTFTAALVIGLGACAARSETVQPGMMPGPRSMIGPRDLERAPYPNAYDAIKSIRPEWLKAPFFDDPSDSGVGVKVVLDNAVLGSTAALRTIPVTRVAYMNWYDGAAATTQWGPGFEHGAIAITRGTR